MKELIKLCLHFQEPPPNALPKGSVSLNGAAETQFTLSSTDSTYEVCHGRPGFVHVPQNYKVENIFKICRQFS